MPTPELGVLFDSDSTLIDSARFHIQHFCEIYRRRGYTLTLPMVYAAHGHTFRESIAIWNRRLGVEVSFAEFDAEIIALIAEQEDEFLVTALEPETVTFLDYLRHQAVPCAVVTSMERSAVVRRYGKLRMDRWFPNSRIITLCDVRQPKPHPEPFLTAAERIGVTPERCVVIGDSPADINGGRAAGMATIAFIRHVPRHCHHTVAHADRVVDCFSKIALPLLRRLVGLHPTAPGYVLKSVPV